MKHSDPECDLNYEPNTARHQEVDAVLSNSLGFGGHNEYQYLKHISNMYNKVSFRKESTKKHPTHFYHLYVPFFLHIHKKRRDEGWGLLKRQNGYICIMDAQKSFVRNLQSIFHCQKRGCIRFLISKGMYRQNAGGAGN